MDSSLKTIESNQVYLDIDFNLLDLQNQRFQSVQFEKCKFIGCNFQESSFLKCSFTDCEFKNCNLSVCDVADSTFDVANFLDSKLYGIKWNKASQRLGFRVKFENCVLDLCNFASLDIKETNFSKSSIKEGYFHNNNLVKAKFGGCDLTQALFHECDLSKADFRGATNYSIDFRTNKLDKAQFNLPEAISLLDGLNIITTWSED
jgi:uncharacterized protein YjbI with pentapeptide repeats